MTVVSNLGRVGFNNLVFLADLSALIAANFSNTQNIVNLAIDVSNYGVDALNNAYYGNNDRKEADNIANDAQKMTKILIASLELVITDKVKQNEIREAVYTALVESQTKVDDWLLANGLETREKIDKARKEAQEKIELTKLLTDLGLSIN